MQRALVFGAVAFALFVIASGGGEISALAAGFGQFIQTMLSGVVEFLSAFIEGLGGGGEEVDSFSQ